MADLASRSDAVVIHGPRGVHFEDEVLSWHRVNGQDDAGILPAILITTRHPSTFRESFSMLRSDPKNRDALLFLPFHIVARGHVRAAVAGCHLTKRRIIARRWFGFHSHHAFRKLRFRQAKRDKQTTGPD
jgi:hypothetical protein